MNVSREILRLQGGCLVFVHLDKLRVEFLGIKLWFRNDAVTVVLETDDADNDAPNAKLGVRCHLSDESDASKVSSAKQVEYQLSSRGARWPPEALFIIAKKTHPLYDRIKGASPNKRLQEKRNMDRSCFNM